MGNVLVYPHSGEGKRKHIPLIPTCDALGSHREATTSKSGKSRMSSLTTTKRKASSNKEKENHAKINKYL